MSKFPKQLINDMWDANVRFDSIMHIPTLVASSSERVSDQFQDFLSDAYEDYQSAALLEQCHELASTLKEIRENEDIGEYAREVAQDLCRQCGEHEFLVNLEICIPYNFKFDEHGEFRSNSLGGIYQMKWILAKDMVDAATIAIKEANAVWEEKCEKAKKEMGVQS